MEPKASDKVTKKSRDSHVMISYIILFIIGMNVTGWGIYLAYLIPSEYPTTISAYFGVGIPFLISGFLVKKRTTGGYYKGLILLFIGIILGFYFISPSPPTHIQFGIYSIESPVNQISQDWHIAWQIYAWGMEALDVLALYLLFISKDKFHLVIATKWKLVLKIASTSLVAIMLIMFLYGIFYGSVAVTTWLAIVAIIAILWPWELLLQFPHEKRI